MEEGVKRNNVAVDREEMLRFLRSTEFNVSRSVVLYTYNIVSFIFDEFLLAH